MLSRGLPDDASVQPLHRPCTPAMVRAAVAADPPRRLDSAIVVDAGALDNAARAWPLATVGRSGQRRTR
jgi:hypothetical protein